MATEHRPTWSKTHPVYSAKHTQKTCVHEKHFLCNLERFSIDWCKTKTKIIITADEKNPSRTNENSKLKQANCQKRGKTRVTKSWQERILSWSWLVLVLHLRERREFSRPITERRKAKPIESRIAFGTKSKIAPNSSSSYASKKIFRKAEVKMLSVCKSKSYVNWQLIEWQGSHFEIPFSRIEFRDTRIFSWNSGRSINSYEWPRQNFSLQYQYNIKRKSNENKEK